MEEKNIYYGKTVEEAVEAGLTDLGITAEQAEVTVLEEGKKKLLGGAKAKVMVVKKADDDSRAVEFIEELLEILGINAVVELTPASEEDKAEICITSTESSRIIGRHGDSLDAIQTLAGAVANIGRDSYKKVVVDCENYRAGREQTLTELALRLAKKAVEKRRRVTLEPMNPYERRIIHSALSESEEVTTTSSGKEPERFVVIIPNNEIEGERPYAIRGHERGRGRGDRRSKERSGRGDRRSHSGGGSSKGAPRGKKEIHFGTFLGNSKQLGEDSDEE